LLSAIAVGYVTVMGIGLRGTVYWAGLAVPAIAQTSATPEEINQYAQAVLAIDRYRNEAYTEVKNLLLSVNMDMSQINATCDQQDFSQVPRSVRRQVREILVDYCNQAKDIVENSGLTSRRFNDITQALSMDQVLYERIQQELIRLQG
jgi:hypothetical protein